MNGSVSVRTCLWFEKDGFSAAAFYADLIPNSRVETRRSPGEEPVVVDFILNGTPYQILNGGPHYQLNPACSIAVQTPDQNETDRIWGALLDNGGTEGRCGWLTDRWGVSWQVYPSALLELLGSTDREAAARAQDAMMQMTKIEIATARAAFDDA